MAANRGFVGGVESELPRLSKSQTKVSVKHIACCSPRFRPLFIVTVTYNESIIRRDFIDSKIPGTCLD